ncbi:universal stress protein [Bacillus marinisedimentorum]|uniref:universal stress protein n=1 Tax=Bacillus marinisedimentorum TaxID=1821260 RepID=UPI0008728435|nr:universal stress protein [Bacillus marinisedimentorum]
MNKLLVPVDGSEHSKKAFKFALTMAKGQDAEVVALNVQPTYHTPNMRRFCSEQQIREYQNELSNQALNTILSESEDTDHIKISKKVRTGDPGIEICKEAKEINAMMIVMGNRGLGAIKSTVLGSVSYRVVHDAPCPVTIVP